jgi:hypothetical protein
LGRNKRKKERKKERNKRNRVDEAKIALVLELENSISKN